LVTEGRVRRLAVEDLEIGEDLLAWCVSTKKGLRGGSDRIMALRQRGLHSVPSYVEVLDALSERADAAAPA
jgi:hypothetical protein